MISFCLVPDGLTSMSSSVLWRLFWLAPRRLCWVLCFHVPSHWSYHPTRKVSAHFINQKLKHCVWASHAAAREQCRVCQTHVLFLHQTALYLEVPENGQIILFSTFQGLSYRRSPVIVGCFLYICAKSLWSCPTLCDPMAETPRSNLDVSQGGYWLGSNSGILGSC